MRGNKTQVLIYLDVEMDAAMRAAAKEAGQSITEYVRRAIAASLGQAPWLPTETRDDTALRESLQRWHRRGDR